MKAIVFVVVAVGAGIIWTTLPDDLAIKRASTWQRLASPGPLLRAHRNLEDDCDACHTSVTGADPVKCIICHANDADLLQRQPTAFHASVGSCRECHPEHLGRDVRIEAMDHDALARVGLRQLAEAQEDDEAAEAYGRLADWRARTRVRSGPATGNRHLSAEEAVLACETCHANDDPHFEFFGDDCGACHATDRWTLLEFRHPSPRSRDCAQCHAAPPSHYMGHFKMVSARVAGRPHARVEQCFACHQTTSWIDIRGVGLYKHH